jgi:hypothetical protein
MPSGTVSIPPPPKHATATLPTPIEPDVFTVSAATSTMPAAGKKSMSLRPCATLLVMKPLFTERQTGTKPRIEESLTLAASAALWMLLRARREEEWFGYSFPNQCFDGYRYAGTSNTKFGEALSIWQVSWPGDDIESLVEIPDGEIFDVIEFAYEHVAQPSEPSFHSYGNHSHYSYDVKAGRSKFAADVNRIFERNGIAYSLESGEVVRIAPAILHEALATTLFTTGDTPLDELLQTAREKFLSRSLLIRSEALKELWDAWERLKTVLPGKDKRERATALLDRAAVEPTIRQRLEEEAAALTKIGNTFMIRHTEVDKIPVTDSAHIDYLFHRMFALIRLLLKSNGLGG